MSKDLVRAEEPSVNVEAGILALKAIIGVIPYVGPLLNEALFDYRSRIKQERVNAYFHGVSEEIRRMVSEKIDFDYLKSEEFSDLLEDLVKHAACTQSETKRQNLRNILLNALTGKREPDLSRSFLNMLSETSDREIQLFGILFRRYRSSPKAPNKKWEDMKFLPADAATIGFESNEYLMLVQSLIRKGLLLDNVFRVVNATSYAHLTLTELGEKFHDYIISDVAP